MPIPTILSFSGYLTDWQRDRQLDRRQFRLAVQVQKLEIFRMRPVLRHPQTHTQAHTYSSCAARSKPESSLHLSPPSLSLSPFLSVHLISWRVYFNKYSFFPRLVYVFYFYYYYYYSSFFLSLPLGLPLRWLWENLHTLHGCRLHACVCVCLFLIVWVGQVTASFRGAGSR